MDSREEKLPWKSMGHHHSNTSSTVQTPRGLTEKQMGLPLDWEMAVPELPEQRQSVPQILSVVLCKKSGVYITTILKLLRYTAANLCF